MLPTQHDDDDDDDEGHCHNLYLEFNSCTKTNLDKTIPSMY